MGHDLLYGTANTQCDQLRRKQFAEAARFELESMRAATAVPALAKSYYIPAFDSFGIHDCSQ